MSYFNVTKQNTTVVMKLSFCKHVSILVLIASVVLLNSGCTKNSDLPPIMIPVKHNIQGVWVGTASNATITIPYYLTIKPDGTCSFEGISTGNVENFGTGTWTLTGTAFTCRLTTLYGVSNNIGINQTVTGVFDTKAGTLTSLTWNDISPATDQGTFTLAKSQDQLQGVWGGTASNATITIPYYLTIKPDGTCSFEGISAGKVENFGTGTWTLTGTTFNASLITLYGVLNNIGIQQAVTGLFDSKAETLTSFTWKDIAPATDQGTFLLIRSN
jgi:hypothetical protein